jgi:hypothetical protein
MFFTHLGFRHGAPLLPSPGEIQCPRDVPLRFVDATPSRPHITTGPQKLHFSGRRISAATTRKIKYQQSTSEQKEVAAYTIVLHPKKRAELRVGFSPGAIRRSSDPRLRVISFISSQPFPSFIACFEDSEVTPSLFFGKHFTKPTTE